jgi:hypothetical protein
MIFNWLRTRISDGRSGYQRWKQNYDNWRFKMVIFLLIALVVGRQQHTRDSHSPTY